MKTRNENGNVRTRTETLVQPIRRIVFGVLALPSIKVQASTGLMTSVNIGLDYMRYQPLAEG